MELNVETKIALIGLCITSIFAVIGLFLNFLALRQNNKIAVSTKLAEASKILSDELVAVCSTAKLIEKELKEAETYPDSEQKVQKIAGLKDLLNKKLARQKEIDLQQDEISMLFKNLSKISPGQADEAISISYSARALSKSSHDLVKEIKNGRS